MLKLNFTLTIPSYSDKFEISKEKILGIFKKSQDFEISLKNPEFTDAPEDEMPFADVSVFNFGYLKSILVCSHGYCVSGEISTEDDSCSISKLKDEIFYNSLLVICALHYHSFFLEFEDNGYVSVDIRPKNRERWNTDDFDLITRDEIYDEYLVGVESRQYPVTNVMLEGHDPFGSLNTEIKLHKELKKIAQDLNAVIVIYKPVANKYVMRFSFLNKITTDIEKEILNRITCSSVLIECKLVGANGNIM